MWTPGLSRVGRTEGRSWDDGGGVTGIKTKGDTALEKLTEKGSGESDARGEVSFVNTGDSALRSCREATGVGRVCLESEKGARAARLPFLGVPVGGSAKS